MCKQKLAFVTSMMNIMIALFILLLGGFSYLCSISIITLISSQIILVFSAGFILCYIFSYCYMLTRSIETHIIGDILFHVKFPDFIHKNVGISVLFIWGMTLLLWGPIIWYSLNINTIILNSKFFVAWVIIWVSFMRAVDYAEQKLAKCNVKALI